MPSRNATLALYVGGFMGPFGGAVLGVLVPELQETFHASRDAVAAAIPAYLIPFAALQLISGTVGERLGVTRVIRTGFIVYAIGSLIAAFAPTLNIFIAARFVQGGSNAFLTPLLLATLAEIVPPQLLTRAMGTFASVQTGALSLAPLIGGLLAVVNWRLAFLLSACVGVALAIFTARTAGGAPPRRRERASMRSLLTRRLGFLCGCAFLGYATVAGVGYMVSFYARDEMGLGPLERGLVLACFGAAGFVLGRPLGSAVQVIGRVPAVIIGALFSALCVAPLGLTVTPWQLAALWTLAGAGSVLLWTGLNTLAVEAVPENRGGATSMFGAFRFAGSALSPYVFLPIYNVAPEHAFFACAVAACAIVPLAVAIRTLTPDPAVRPVSCNAMSDCIFCGIVAGTMPSERIYEDERTIAFLDIFPAADGHVLVIPRAHADNIHGADPADVAAVAQTAQILAGRVGGALASDGVTITQANGAAAGQTVFHYHVHVIPRFDGDGVLNPWKPGHATPKNWPAWAPSSAASNPAATQAHRGHAGTAPKGSGASGAGLTPGGRA